MISGILVRRFKRERPKFRDNAKFRRDVDGGGYCATMDDGVANCPACSSDRSDDGSSKNRRHSRRTSWSLATEMPLQRQDSSFLTREKTTKDQVQREVRAMRARLKVVEGGGVIRPRANVKVLVWDFFCLIAAMYVAIGQMIDIMCTDPRKASSFGISFYIGLFLSAIFAIDCALNLRRAYRVDGTWITNKRAIFRHYAITWFVPDLIAAMPYELLTQPVLIPGVAVPGTWECTFLRMLPMLRLLRGLKSVRLDKHCPTLCFAILDKKDRLGLMYAPLPRPPHDLPAHARHVQLLMICPPRH